MIRLRHLGPAGVLGASLALAGCLGSDDSPTSTTASGGDDVTAQEEAIQVVILEEEADLTDTDVRYFDDGSGAALAPVATHAWRRQVLDRDRTIEITIDDPGDEPPTADVSVQVDVTGLLHLAVCDGDSLRRISKDFQDTGVRSLYFERVRVRDGSRHRGWKLQALSGMLIESPGTTRQIHSVRIQAGDVDETITNVTDLVRVGDLLTLPSGSEVMITVDTGDATDSVFLHRRHARHRSELVNNGDGTFSTRFQIAVDRRGFRHLAIDVLSEGTLYDDTAPYDNVAWGIPYRVWPEPTLSQP